MKIFANTKKHEFEYELRQENGNGILFKDGKILNVEFISLGSGRYSLIKDNMTYIVNISKKEDNYNVRVAGDQFDVAVEDERTRQVKALVNAAGSSRGEKTIKAPIPGLVVKILAKAGEKVKADNSLLILEAMKMENIIKAPFDCEVVKINVKEKDAVTQNQLLLKIKGIS
jgi:biotin carboxyl carrier protein